MWFLNGLASAIPRLYLKFGMELFTFSEAKKLLPLDENRLLNPENFLFLVSGTLKNVEKIASERYLKLILDCLRFLLKNMDLESFAVYGSVARGSPSQYSDVDILLVSDSLEGSLGSRIEKLYHVEKTLEEELKWLRNHGVYTSLSFYPLRREEAQRLPLLFLDLTEEATILYDRNSFLETTLLELKSKLLKQGAKRVIVNKEHWYWDLNPNHRLGEKIEIA